MKYLILVPDGAADYAVDALGRRTPLQAARTPNMDRLAAEGRGGLVPTIPPSRHPGSDIGNLEIFGYDTTRYYTGRAPLEAASLGLEMGPDDVAFRLNLIHRDGDTLVDYSAGHISTGEGEQLVAALAAAQAADDLRFTPGVGYRHILVVRGGPEGLADYPPHDIMGQSIAAHLPRGEGATRIRALMQAAEPVLASHPVNAARRAAGKAPANAIWLWGAGRPLVLPTVGQRYGLQGGVISAVDLVRGIGRCAGYDVVDVPAITGFVDTNYEGKAEHALAAMGHGADLVYLHVEAPDECGHSGDARAKVAALEDFDTRVVGPVLQGLSSLGSVRVLLAPDHRTPIRLRTHSREPVPFVLWGDRVEADGMTAFDEIAAESGSLQLAHGHEMMSHLVTARAGPGRPERRGTQYDPEVDER